METWLYRDVSSSDTTRTGIVYSQPFPAKTAHAQASPDAKELVLTDTCLYIL